MFQYLLILFTSIHLGFAKDPCAQKQCHHTQTCVVQNGLAVCMSKKRICSAWGGLHYNTLDGRTFDFHGTCNYTFVKVPCNGSSDVPSSIEVQIARGVATNATKSFDRVLISVHGLSIAIVKGELLQAWVNGMRRRLPWYVSDTVKLYLSGSSVVLDTGLGLVLRYDWFNHLEVRLSRNLSNTACGLCGGFTRNSTHNLPALGANITGTDLALAVEEFARSWKTSSSSSCSDGCGSSCPHCDPAQLGKTPGVKLCGLMKDPKGLFANCLKTVNPASYVQACKADLCMQKGDNAVACQALKAYADVCQGSGVRISPWRELANCSMACRVNSHHENCGTLCPATCADPAAPSRCPLGCAETCQCDKGFLLCGKGCVRPSKCGCTYQGSYHLRNETFWADKCQQRCTCDPATKNVTCVPARCEHDEKCLLRDGAYSCHKGTHGLCLAQGDPHYTTLDGRRFDFDGNCVYLLAAHCPTRGPLPDFKIEVQNERRAAESFSKMVRARLHGYEVEISWEVKDKVFVNGLLLGLPTVLSWGKVKIYKTGLSLYVESDFGLMLTYNWNNLVTVAVPRNFSSAICGICGNFNGDKHDDLVPPMGPEANSSISLQRWKTNEVPGCTDVIDYDRPQCPPDIRLILSKGDSCGKLVDPKGPFRDCHDIINPLDSFENCINDVWLNNGSRAVLCQVLSSYVSACQDAGAVVHSWRSKEFCNMSCPANSKYMLCSPPVPHMCTKPPSPHGAICQEGCECLPGFLRSGEKCIPESDCGCLYDGVYHEAGETFFPDERCLTECTCEHRGRVHCRNTTCPAGLQCGVKNGKRRCYPELGSGRCSLSGEVHLRTFDGHSLDVRGTCGYVLAQKCDTSKGNGATAFSVYIQRGQLHLQIYGTNLTLASSQSGKVKVNGVLWNLPALLGQLSVVQLGLRMQVETDAGVIVAYDLQNFVQLTVPRGYAGRLCGLCGDFDGNPANDPRIRNGNITSNITAFSASWKVSGLDANCTDGCGDQCPVCNRTKAARYRSGESCGLLSASTGPFQECLPVVDPQPHLENCVYDMCISHGDEEKYCGNLQAYTLACQSAGARVQTWRNITSCSLACPPHSQYSISVESCPVTCTNTSLLACQSSQAEGCQCDPGFQLSAGHCVKAEECGCFQDGRYYEVGEASWTEGCKEKCNCSAPAALQCVSASCPEGWGCGVVNGSTDCVGKGLYPRASNGTRTMNSCWVLGGSHFYTFDGTVFDFLGNCTYTLAQRCHKGNSSPPFSVQIEKSQDRFTALKSIHVTVSEDHIVMKPGDSFVWVNTWKKLLPVSLPGVKIHESGLFVVLDTKFGLSVKYNRAQYVLVDLPKNFTNVCGLCGDNNGNALDDLRTQEGAVADEVAFGWSWRVEDGSASCEADCLDCLSSMEDLQLDVEMEHDFTVRVLLWSESSPFTQCHVVVDPSAYSKLCARHHCVKQWDSEFLCEALQSYTSACQAAWVRVKEWRNSTFCSANCPKHSHYELCGSACPATCGDPAPDSKCKLPCMESCHCDEGFLFEVDSCVPASSCGCMHQGSYHRRDQPFWADDACSERCVCKRPGEPAHCVPSSCGPLAFCRLQGGERACLPYQLGSCSLESGRHFQTFDGHSFEFQGSCAYQLVGLCSDEALAPLEVQVQNTGDVQSALKVVVKVHNVTVEIGSKNGKLVKVDGLRKNLPFVLNGGTVSVHTVGLRTLLHTDFGASITLFPNGRLCIGLSSKYAGATCGLCGNYNGDPIDDLTGHGGHEVLSPSELVRSWDTRALPWCVGGCQGDCHKCTPEQREGYSKPNACGALLNKTGPFRVCHSKLAPGRFYNNCISDLCWEGGTRAALCRSLANYVAACQEENVKIYDWRSPDFCDQQCPQGTVYELCPILLNNSCKGSAVPNATLSPPGVCYENCICPTGLSLSGSVCVHPGDCGCIHQGEYLHIGDVILTCRERCVCKAGGAVACHPLFCTEDEECRVQGGLRGCYPRSRFGHCSLTGRSHYSSYDGWDFDFPGTCNYTLSHSCAPLNSSQRAVPFSVRLLYGKSDRRQICVESYGLKLMLSSKHPNQVLVGGVLETLPFSAGNMTVYRLGLYLTVQALNSVQVTFDLRNHVVVRLPESYKNGTCGLCGNYNGDPADDLWLPNSTVTELPDGEEGAEVCSDGCGDNCPHCVSLLPRYASDHHCGLIKAPAGAFNACHPLVDPAGYYSNCMYDLCVSEGRLEQLCDGLQAYAVACQETGVQVSPWRNGTKCMFQCPEFSHYTPCANACSAVCAEVRHMVECPAGCVEGCQCDKGFYYDGNRCVPQDMCGCFLEGRRYQPGEMRLLQNCTLNCTCGPPVMCKPHACPSSHVCTVKDGVMTCQSTDPCEGKCGAYETCAQKPKGPVCNPPVLDLCWAWGDPHFRSFSGTDFDMDGTCTYVLAASGGRWGLTPFTVTEKNEKPNGSLASSARAVNISVYGYVVTMDRLDKDAVRVNGLRSRLPISLRDRIRVDYWGELVMLQTDFGLQVIFDWASLVLVALHPMYRGEIYGLCAYDGGETSMVKGAPKRARKSVIEWAKMHAISDGNWQCCTDCAQPSPNITPEDEQRSRERCAVLREATGPFALCNKEVAPDSFLQGCVSDLTNSGGAQNVLKQALKSYTAICQYHGFTFGDPGNLYYDEPGVCGPYGELNICASPCLPSCDEFTSPACNRPCMRGCVCKAGYVNINRTCLPMTDCGCLDSIGQLRKQNETFWSPENCEDQCTCNPSTRTIECVRVSCPTGQHCQLVSGIRGCYPTNRVTCTLMGGLHFQTFNGHVFDFRGGYTYRLVGAQPHVGTMVPFSICIANASDSTRLFLSLDLRVDVYGKVLVISKEAPYKLKVDWLYTPLPYHFNKGQILAYHSPSSITIQTDFGLHVVVGRTGTINVVVPGWYSSVLSGLCGKPSDPKGALVTPSGWASNLQEFAKSWKIGAVGHPLPPDPRQCTREEQNLFKDFHFCQVLLDEQGPFKQCNDVLDPRLYYEACLADTCAFGGHPAVLCNSISDYATACLASNITVREWRQETFCGMECPVNSHYELCGTSCPETCSQSLSPATCSMPYQEGCQCDSGLVLSDGKCVPRSECGCTYKGQYFPRGTFILGDQCQEKCHCGEGSKMVCSSSSCRDLETCVVEGGFAKCMPTNPGTCHVLGGFGYITFDGYALAHHGICSYVLVQSNASTLPHFKVLVSVEREEKEHDPLKAVVLMLGEETEVEIFPKILWKVKFNKEYFTLPMEINNGAVKAYQDGGSSVLETDFGLQIRATSTHYVQVIVPRAYCGATSGLCGNYNGDSADDLKRSSKMTAGSPLAFLRSCAEAVPGQHCSLDCRANCGPCKNFSKKGHCKSCDLLASKSGPFQNCHNVVPVEPYIDVCLKVCCATSRKQEALCLSLEAYAVACKAKGIKVDTWRGENCRLKCPDQSHASSSVDSCSSTCPEILSPGLCKRQYEGCQCNDSLVFNGATCAPLSQCGCMLGGRYIKNKEYIYGPGCTKRCWCELLGGATCEQTACSTGERCLVRDGVWGCHNDIGTCLVQPNLAFKTLDGLESNLKTNVAFNLASLCDRKSDHWFQLILFKGHCDEKRTVDALHLFLHGVTLVIQNGRVYVDGDLVSCPLSLPSGVSVNRVWDWPEVRIAVRKSSGSESQPDLELEASSTGMVMVRPSANFKLCGACGNYNELAGDDLPHSYDWIMSLDGCAFGDLEI
ncbi:hypothetical protein GJAV_G00004990 [Gymnothorax javanicus]|nr:hypothetical protein GJAV_G00004990 [Gymnothorax javanicus]